MILSPHSLTHTLSHTLSHSAWTAWTARTASTTLIRQYLNSSSIPFEWHVRIKSCFHQHSVLDPGHRSLAHGGLEEDIIIHKPKVIMEFSHRPSKNPLAGLA